MQNQLERQTFSPSPITGSHLPSMPIKSKLEVSWPQPRFPCCLLIQFQLKPRKSTTIFLPTVSFRVCCRYSLYFPRGRQESNVKHCNKHKDASLHLFRKTLKTERELLEILFYQHHKQLWKGRASRSPHTLPSDSLVQNGIEHNSAWTITGEKNRILDQEHHLTMQEEEALTRLATIKYQKHSQMVPR